MQQTRQNIQSTNISSNEPSIPKETNPTNTITTIFFDPTDSSYSDITGRLPVQSSLGNNYILILHHLDSNAILAEPIQTRHSLDILKAFKSMHTYITNKGFKIEHHILDNECPQALVDYFQTNNIKHQLVPPYIHRVNRAERAIQTFKHHFIAGLSSTPSTFPMYLWCRLIPQAVITLNLLRQSNTNTCISSYLCYVRG